MKQQLAFEALRSAVAGGAAAFRCVTEYQPAGGPGDKTFPATYEGGKYAMETRTFPGAPEPVDCVLIDSVQSQANRMELALLDAWERQQLTLPVISVQFPNDAGLRKPLRITSLEAPHRVADALLRDSRHDGTPFRQSEIGRAIDDAEWRNATPLFHLCPTALVFGMWDSTGPRGGMGAKFQRAIVSEIVGVGVVAGVKTSSRIDPAAIPVKAGPLFKARDGGWTLDESKAVRDKKGPVKLGKDGKPSEANHGNVTPSITSGGVTLQHAIQTTVVSLPALRRLRFPIDGQRSTDVEDAARTVLAAIGLCAATLAREQGCDLRSRCFLIPTAKFQWELLGQPGTELSRFELDGPASIQLLQDAIEAAKKAGLPWMDEELVLAPSDELTELVRRSQELAATDGVDAEDGD